MDIASHCPLNSNVSTHTLAQLPDLIGELYALDGGYCTNSQLVKVLKRRDDVVLATHEASVAHTPSRLRNHQGRWGGEARKSQAEGGQEGLLLSEQLWVPTQEQEQGSQAPAWGKGTSEPPSITRQLWTVCLLREEESVLFKDGSW